ncbi:hypothetical protein WJX72_009746 [[Myrmecia] bisecta]|uniref:ABC transporter domain-containing protein n=1 Tax=[Myrmecia] bisecta TaxID=41462 RepID=A0AAW1P1I1_9CHLO
MAVSTDVVWPADAWHQPQQPPRDAAPEASPRKLGAPFHTQAGALVKTNAAFQKRKWGTNAVLLATPLLFSLFLWILQTLINRQLGSQSYHCGCKCTACCDWLPIPGSLPAKYEWTCYSATDARPCSPYASCSEHDTSRCGLVYSTADQVPYCSVDNPPLWPALLQVPMGRHRDPSTNGSYTAALPGPNGGLNSSATPLLYTGQDRATADALMAGLLARDAPVSAALLQTYQAASEQGRLQASNATQPIASDAQFANATDALSQLIVATSAKPAASLYIEGLLQSQLVMGTAAEPAASLYIEPAFFPQATTSGQFGQQSSGVYPEPHPLYVAAPNCNVLGVVDTQVLANIGQALSNATGVPTQCASLFPAWRDSSADMSQELYCGWRGAHCVYLDGRQVSDSATNAKTDDKAVRQYTSALYDWGATTRSALYLTIWANDSNAAESAQGPPVIDRWNQPMNLAANTYLRSLAGPGFGARLEGLRDMPKAASNLTLDFSSLLGPLFFMWLMQLLLPVNVYALVHEKEAGLRLMMKMQGLSDRALHVVTYLWQLCIYIAFMFVFVVFGGLIGLKIFTRNSYGVQAVFYLLWGNLLSAWSLWYAALNARARPAVMLCIVWVILSGFVANLALVQFVEHGPGVAATLLQLVPSFALYRGLYELSQYAFLADRNGGSGLTWQKLHDPGNAMIAVWITLAVEWALFLAQAWYIEQIIDTGTGVRRHPLFFLGFHFTDAVKLERKRKGAPLPEQAQQAQQAEAGSLVLMRTTSAETDQHTKPGQVGYYGTSAGAFGEPASAQPACRSKMSIQAGTRLWQDNPMAAGDLFPEIRPMSEDEDLPLRTSAVLPGPDRADGSGGVGGQDVEYERVRVEALWHATGGKGGTPETAILLHKLRKVYPGRNGNPAKVAVKGLSLAIARCECFGLLGPNGAGKTTTLKMLEGFAEPTSGTAIIEGHNVRHDMAAIYTRLGTCMQGDLLWGALTGREHLLFYARLHNLKGPELEQAVSEGLRSVNLLAGGAGDRLVDSYSGGMKRRLSVAAALVGNPSVVYLDEPSTGLDPASRHLLWDVVRAAKRAKAVVLTTHSMEEAEALCDRLGIFVAGQLQCIGSPKELTARYGSYLSFSITTPSSQDLRAAALVLRLAPTSRKVYALNGTQKFELPVAETAVEEVFVKVEEAKTASGLDVLDWGVSNATLEDVFIKISREAGAVVAEND